MILLLLSNTFKSERSGQWHSPLLAAAELTEDTPTGGGPGKFGLRSLFVVEEEDEEGVVLPLTLDPF